MFKYGFDLLMRHAWKPLQKLIDRDARFQVFEKRLNRYPSSTEHPRATDLFVRALDFRAITPIEHDAHVIRVLWGRQGPLAT